MLSIEVEVTNGLNEVRDWGKSDDILGRKQPNIRSRKRKRKLSTSGMLIDPIRDPESRDNNSEIE